MIVDKHLKKKIPKSSILWRVIAFWSLKTEKAHYEHIEIKVFGTTFEKQNFTSLMYIYWRINDDSESIFDADQHPEVHLVGNDYSLALISKENTKKHTYKTGSSYCNAI